MGGIDGILQEAPILQLNDKSIIWHVWTYTHMEMSHL